VSQPTETPAPYWTVQAVTPRISALYLAASILRGIAFKEADLLHEMGEIAAGLDAQADLETRKHYVAEVEARKKGAP
jgi:hypothetical protein